MKEKELIYLVKCVLNNQAPDLSQMDDLSAVYSSAAKHKVSVLVSSALKAGGVEDKSHLMDRNLRRILLFENDWRRIKAELAGRKIWYMPLKGMLLRDCYPSPGMREFADYDILFDEARADDVRRIMEAAGFESKSFGSGAHDIYYKAPVLNFEMHRVLFAPSDEDSFAVYYRNVKERLLSVGEYEYRFSPEDFYIFMIAHEYKHYSHRGTGLRPLVDTFVYLRKEKLDMDYVQRETKKLGIDEFELANRSLALHLFGDGALTDRDREMLNDFLESGVYGTYDRNIENQLKRSGNNKLLYLLQRFPVPVSKKNKYYNDFAIQYPLFYRYRILLPLLPFYRVSRALWSGRMKREFKAVLKSRRTK